MRIDRQTVEGLTAEQLAALDEVDQAELDRWLKAGAPVGAAPAEPWPTGHRFTIEEVRAMTPAEIAAHIDDVEASLHLPPAT